MTKEKETKWRKDRTFVNTYSRRTGRFWLYAQQTANNFHWTIQPERISGRLCGSVDDGVSSMSIAKECADVVVRLMLNSDKNLKKKIDKK